MLRTDARAAAISAWEEVRGSGLLARYSSQGNPMDRGAGGLQSMGPHSRTGLKRLSRHTGPRGCSQQSWEQGEGGFREGLEARFESAHKTDTRLLIL